MLVYSQDTIQLFWTIKMYRKTNKTRAIFVLKNKGYAYVVTDKRTGELYATVRDNKIIIFNDAHKRSVTRFIKRCMRYGYLEN